MRKLVILSLALFILLCLVCSCSKIVNSEESSELETSKQQLIIEVPKKPIIDIPEEPIIEGVVMEEEKEPAPTVEKTTVEVIGLLKEGPDGTLLTYGREFVNETNILVLRRDGKLKNAETALRGKELFYGFLTDLKMGNTNVYIALEIDRETYQVFAALLYEAANNQNEIMNYDSLFIINSWLELPLYGYEDRTDSEALRASAFNLALRDGRISEAQYLIEQIYYSLMEKTSN